MATPPQPLGLDGLPPTDPTQQQDPSAAPPVAYEIDPGPAPEEILGLGEGGFLPPPPLPPNWPEAPVPQPDGTLAAPDFYRNLAESEVSESEMQRISSDVRRWADSDESAMTKWVKTLKDTQEYLGLEHKTPDSPFPGASGIYSTILLEAIIRFQSEAESTLFGTQGPCRTVIYGDITDDTEKQAANVQDHFNWVLNEEIPGYREETSALLWDLGQCGTVFTKVTQDPLTGKPDVQFIPGHQFLAPSNYSTLERCPRYAQLMVRDLNAVKRLQFDGYYRDVSLTASPEHTNAYQDQQRKVSGFERGIYDLDTVNLIEMHAAFTIDGLPETDHIQSKFALPYVVTIDRDYGAVLGIRRNWLEGDPTFTRRDSFVHYNFIPGPFGLYGIGLSHILANTVRGCTMLERQLCDAGTLSNLQGGFYLRDLQIEKDDVQVDPTQWKSVTSTSATTMPLANYFYTPQYAPPNSVLLELLSALQDQARRASGNSDVDITDMPNGDMASGATLALLEKGMTISSAVYARIHKARAKEFKLLYPLIKGTIDPSLAQVRVPGKSVPITREDYDLATVGVVPVSSPDAATMSQRVLQMQGVGTMAQQMPSVFDQKEVARASLRAIGVQDVERLVPDPDTAPQLDPGEENARIMRGEPVKVFPGQDHQSHIAVHMAALQEPRIQQIASQDPNAATIEAAARAHIWDHVAEQQILELKQQSGQNWPPSDQMTPDQQEQLAPIQAAAAQQILQQQLAAAQQQQQPAGQPPQGTDPGMLALKQGDLQLKQEKMQQDHQQFIAKQTQQHAEFLMKNQLEQARMQKQQEQQAHRLNPGMPQQPGGKPPQ